MSAGSRLGKLVAELWPPGSKLEAYAIVDGARDERIYPAVTASKLEQCCLYAGQLPKVMLETAPYLLRLDREQPFTLELLELGWGESWGIFLLASAPLEELRRHFRRFLRVKDESGRILIFRYHDPRVLRVYLPTCTAGELRAIFGPVAMYLVEDEDPGTLLRFHRAEAGLGRDEVLLGGEVAEGPTG